MCEKFVRAFFIYSTIMPHMVLGPLAKYKAALGM